MTLSDFRRITDELLSAYIDDEVTEQERALVEAAIAADEGIAWRLDSLRQTVTLLRELPEVVLPRSFTLTFDQVRMPQADEQLVGVGAMEQPPVALPLVPPHLRPSPAFTPQAEAGFWEQVQEGWRRFWQGGNPMLRNAAAVSFVLMLLITGGGQILNRALTQPAGMMATAPEAAPASSEAADAVALAPTATNSNGTGSGETESRQVQEEPASNKTAGIEEAEAQTEASDTAAVGNAVVNTAESPAFESEAPEENEEDAYAVQEEAAITEAAPSSDTAQTASATESAAVAAMAAPAAAPPSPGGPRPQSGGGGGLGAGGGMDGLPPEMGGGETGLVPNQAYGFDANPVGEPTTLPADEAVSASVAAAPAAEAPAESVADVAATPAVDAPVVAAASARSASVGAATEMTTEASASSAAPAAESDIVSDTVTEIGSVTESIPESVSASEQTTQEAVVDVTAAPLPEAAGEATAEAVALVAPEPITSSVVVENVPVDGAVVATSSAGNLPVVWVAQGTLFLLTIMLTSLWWRSRTPRRPRQS